MDQTIHYRQAGNTYSEKIIQLILPIQQMEFNAPVTLEDQPDLLSIEQSYHQTGGGFWVAMQGEEIIGTIALIVFDKGKGALRKMFVKKEFRGKEHGVAARLLQILLDYCHRTGIQDIYLGTINRMQAALRFYAKNGFVEVAKASLPPRFPLMQVDTVFYHLSLREQYAAAENSTAGFTGN